MSVKSQLGPLQCNSQPQSCQTFILILNQKIKKKCQIFFVFSEISFVFLMCFEGGQDHIQLNKTLGTCYLYVW
jgi:hypothetical protein